MYVRIGEIHSFDACIKTELEDAVGRRRAIHTTRRARRNIRGILAICSAQNFPKELDVVEVVGNSPFITLGSMARLWTPIRAITHHEHALDERLT